MSEDDFGKFMVRLETAMKLDAIEASMHRMMADPAVRRELERRTRELGTLGRRDLHEAFTI